MQIMFDRLKAIVFSPFGKKTRPFTDVASDGSDLVIGPGKTLPDLIRLFYSPLLIKPLSATFAFLDRDNKEKDYNPGKEDPFVFRDNSSIQQFKTESLDLMKELTSQWTSLKLPVKYDKDRGLDLPDGEKLWEALGTGSALDVILKANYRDILFILSNIDIMKKACIVRGITPGWWASSYSGKDTDHLDHFSPSIRAHIKAIRYLEKTKAYAEKRAYISKHVGDPIDTNVGWPYYSATTTATGVPESRLKVIELFKNIGTANYSYESLIKLCDSRAQGLGTEGFPFAAAPIRRSSYGYKWNHIFKRSSIGLVTDHDERGGNTTRIAWIVPYLMNLIVSPLQSELKAVRMLLPGLYHDGDAKVQRTKQLRDNKYFITEADYSNYDRFMPVNLFLRFIALYLESKPNKQYWYDLVSGLHHNLPVIWPDYVGDSKNHGWIFTPKKLGLLSGVKITSEQGTFVNSIINGQSMIDAGVMDEDKLYSYLIQYADAPVGSKHEYYYIQSDDTAHFSKDLKELKKMGDAFLANVKRAGLKGEIMLGDRFLMRHLTDGKDTPVPARVFQNSLQNEEPYDDQLIFIVGLAMRTDGLLGQKTFDPFQTSRIQVIRKIEVQFTIKVLESLLRFTSTATTPVSPAIDYIKVMLDTGRRMERSTDSSGNCKMVPEDANKLDHMRKSYLKVLAERELKALADGALSESVRQSLLYRLHKASNIPSQKLLLDQMIKGDSKFNNMLESITAKENFFYHFAMKELGIPTQL